MKNRTEMAQEEMTRDPIFLFQVRRVYPNQECFAEYDSERESYIDPEMKTCLNDDDLVRRGWAIVVWETITVLMSRAEGDDYGHRTKHRYGKGRKGIDWRVYCIPCEGTLAWILRESAKKVDSADKLCVCGHLQSQHGSMGICLGSKECTCTEFHQPQPL